MFSILLQLRCNVSPALHLHIADNLLIRQTYLTFTNHSSTEGTIGYLQFFTSSTLWTWRENVNERLIVEHRLHIADSITCVSCKQIKSTLFYLINLAMCYLLIGLFSPATFSVIIIHLEYIFIDKICPRYWKFPFLVLLSTHFSPSHWLS